MRTKTLLLKKHPGGQSTFITRRCKWCGKIFFKKHNRETYCTPKCNYYAQLEKTNNRVRKYRLQKRKQFGYESVKNLGSGHLGPHPDKNMVKEAVLVRKEKNRYKL